MCHLPSAARPRGNAYQASLESRNPLVPVSPRPPSPPSPRGGRGLGRGAQRPFANQKNRRAQNDLGRRPTTPQKRGAVDQGHSAATERTQALDDEPRRPARTRCSAARRSFKGQFDSQHRRRYRASARTSWTSSFVLSFPARSQVGRAGPRVPRPSGSERSASRPSCSSCTVTPTSSSYPACRFPLSPQLIRSCSR